MCMHANLHGSHSKGHDCHPPAWLHFAATNPIGMLYVVFVVGCSDISHPRDPGPGKSASITLVAGDRPHDGATRCPGCAASVVSPPTYHLTPTSSPSPPLCGYHLTFEDPWLLRASSHCGQAQPAISQVHAQEWPFLISPDGAKPHGVIQLHRPSTRRCRYHMRLVIVLLC